jgi:shikimate dehydrogenase
MKKYGLIGASLRHSHSPQIHNSAFKHLNIDAKYQCIEIENSIFNRSIPQLKEGDYSGFNVTIPYKRMIIPFIEEVSTDSKIVEAVNTICIKDNRWYGHNTDIKGFLTPLYEYKKIFNRSLILGSGGAARAVAYALLKYIKTREIYIGCRNRAKGDMLTNQFDHLFEHVTCHVIDMVQSDEVAASVDLIVNTTPLGMSPKIDDQPVEFNSGLAPGTVVYDLIYNPLQTKFLEHAQKAGQDIITINGLEMLISQAAGSFELWTGRKFPYGVVRKELLEIVASAIN